MGAMQGLSRGVTLTLVLALAFILLVPTIPLAEASPASGATSTSPSELQYDPSLLFRNGTVFNDYASSFLAPPGMVDFQIGDVNNDGFKDIVAVNSTAIFFYNRSADGSFNSIPWQMTKSDMVDIQGIAIGDLNGDGANDIAVSNSNSGEDPYVTLFFQHDNSFNPASALAKVLSTAFPHEVLIGHFTYSTNNSVAVVCEGNSPLDVDDSVNIWSYPFLTISSRKPINLGVLKDSEFIAGADFDGNGLEELVVGEMAGSYVQILNHTTSSSTWTQTSFHIPSTATADVALKDVNGDGRADLIHADNANSQVEIFLYNSTLNWLEPDSQAYLHVQDGVSFVDADTVAAGSANALMALSKDSSNLSVSFKRAGGWYGGRPDVYVPVNENPIRAIVDRSIPGKELLVVLSSGRTSANGSFELFPIISNLSGNSDRNVFFGSDDVGQMATGTISGHRIVAVLLPTSSEVVLYNATTGWTRTLTTEAGPVDVAFGGFDGDAYDDLAVLNQGSKTVSVYTDDRLLSGTTPSITVFHNMTGASRLAKASVRGNSYDDLLIGSQNGVKILYNTLDATMFRLDLNETLGGGTAGTITDIAFAEFNADGYPYDVAALNSVTSGIELFFRSASGSPGDYYTEAPSQTIAGTSYLRMAMGDFGGNAWKDLAVLDASGHLLIYRQPTANGFSLPPGSPHATIHLQDMGETIASGDINDDGLDDLVIGFQRLPEVACYLRTGDLAFKNAFNWTSGGIVADVHADDVSNDLRSDVVSSAPDSRSLSVWAEHNFVPRANATASFYTAPEGQQITFSGVGSTDSYSDRSSLAYQWTLNGSMQTGVTAYATFMDNGTYHVSLKVTDRGSLSNWSNLTIIVTDRNPTPNFNYEPTSPVEGTVAYFNDTSTSYPDAIVAWNWSFGDGGFSTSSHATHTYQQNGTYSVRLRVWDDDGGMTEVTRLITVQDTSPVAVFTYAPPSILEGNNYTFTDHSTYLHDPIVSWAWDFGDGEFGSGQSVQHQYVHDGTFTVVLTVTDLDGSPDSVFHDVFVGDIAPVANFTCSNTSPIEGTTVQFNDTSTSYDGVVSWHWDFGDGMASSLRNATHVFAHNRSAPYVVELTVTEADGNTSEFSVLVTVLDSTPIADFEWSPETQMEGLPVHFADNSSAYDEVVAWHWDFGNGNTSDTGDADQTYQNNGYYKVTLTVEDIDASINSTSKWISITDSVPTANFTFGPNSTNESSTVWFNDTSSAHDGLQSWLWNFGDGEQSTDRNTTHVYLDNGTYDVVLSVVDGDGSPNWVSYQIVILDMRPTAAFTNTPCIEGNVTFFYDASTTPIDAIVNWSWDLGDEHLAYGKDISHIYNRSDDFLVVLTVRDDDGSTNFTSTWVHAGNVDPRVAFSILPSTPHEKEDITFVDGSQSFNYLVSWFWDLGDGNTSTLKNPTHAYLRNRTYTVSLTVHEVDGSWNSTSHQIVVLDTSPVIISVIAAPTKQTYNEDETFQIYVYAIKTVENITGYEYDLHYDGTFTKEMDTEFNHTSLSYPEMGTYHIMVRVFDDDGYTQASAYLAIEVVNLQPHAQFSYRNQSSQTVRFDASQSWDTPSDDASLEFSWNFDDAGGFTSYSSSKTVDHAFVEDGVYLIALRVRDNDGSIATAYREITLDRTPPTVAFDEISGSVGLDQVMVISANVSDTMGLDSVWLHYKIDNGTEQVVQMTLQGSASHFQAEIPGVNHAATISYWIVAVDDSQNNYTTGHYMISVAVVPQSDTVLLIVLSAIVLAALLAFFLVRNKRAAVDEVFIIYEDGRLIAHQTRRLKPGMDDEILSSMLIALQSFVKDSFKDESATHLQRLDFGEKMILIEKGDHLFLAVVLHGGSPGSAP
ncbi:MAG: PKD domain-containing protein, partial [Methanomassiliicoccales archaeon]|nr:PKD domain-containing protein [Methanomassiliicoccales archaeon]